MNDIFEYITDLLTEFDEMGFAPTTAVPDPEAYAIKWRDKITKAIEELLKVVDANSATPTSEWISVEERLPELEITRSDGYHRPRSVRVLCVCKQRSGKVFVKEGYYELFSNKPCWRIPGSIDSVTHWMPLPKAPKGGAE